MHQPPQLFAGIRLARVRKDDFVLGTRTGLVALFIQIAIVRKENDHGRFGRNLDIRSKPTNLRATVPGKRLDAALVLVKADPAPSQISPVAFSCKTAASAPDGRLLCKRTHKLFRRQRQDTAHHDSPPTFD